MFEIVYDPLFGDLNELEQPKPFFETYETPLRVKFTWDYLKKIGYLNNSKLVFKRPKPLNKEDIYLVHSKYHFDLVEKLSEIGMGQLGNLVQVTPDTLDIALLSAGGAYAAISDVYNKKYNQSFAIIRPPGHHAIPDAADGLCVFNNIAIAIKKLRKDLEFKGKIAIIDIDAHYGDGLAKIFYEDPKVLYSSIHEFDFEVGEAGGFSDLGLGNGRGYTINFPIPFNSDDFYLKSYCSFIGPFLEKYNPEMIIVAAGFDGHFADPIGNLRFTSRGYQYFASWLKKLSNKICDGRVSFCLEGGYNLLIIPHLIESIISEFLPVKLNSPIDDFAYPYFSKNLSEGKKTSAELDILKIGFNRKIEAFKKRINGLWK
ncbi:MAG: histone deacetylase family protein [Promethearchaeota archaeon]